MTEPTLINEMLRVQHEMQADILEIRLMLAEKKGERRVALWVAAAAGSAVSFIISLAIKLAPLLGKHP